MHKLILLILLAIVGLLPFQCHSGWVKGYTKSNGTYVAPHYRNTSGSKSKGSKANSAATKTTSASPSSSPITSYPKSYQVYQRRQTQGPRAFSKGMKTQKYNEQGGRCNHCGGTFDQSQMEGDHIQPYSKGGKTEYSNLQMLCKPCNRSKGNKGTY